MSHPTRHPGHGNSRLVAVNEKGNLIGEDHPMAVLSDREVQLLLELRMEGFSYNWLAGKFEVSKSCVQKICNGTHRAGIAHAYRRIRARSARG